MKIFELGLSNSFLYVSFLAATFLLASVSAVMLVSYDRLAAAALTTEAKITMKVAPKLVIASWLLSISLSIPWIVKRTYIVSLDIFFKLDSGCILT